MYMRIEPEIALPESLEFSVNKCAAEDKAIGSKITILDTCPLFPGLNFRFNNEQKDQNAVDFSFTSFVFPSSAENTIIELTCDINICPLNTDECLKPCSTTTSTTTKASTTTSPTDVSTNPSSNLPSGTNILVILGTLNKSYITNGDGSETSTVQISAPSNDYAYRTTSAVVKGKLHLFGGVTDKKKIARLDDCTFVELPYKLNFEGNNGHAALSISDNSEALICFDIRFWNSCDVFTGSSVISTYSTRYSHRDGGLGFYNQLPITVGSFYSDGRRKVETLSSTGWTSLANSPMNYYGHQLIGLGNDLLMIAGRDIDGSEVIDAFITAVWRLSDNNWSQEANLIQTVGFGSTIAIEKSIFIVGWGGAYSGFFSQRIDVDENDEIAGIEQIGFLDRYDKYPPLFATSPDYCISN